MACLIPTIATPSISAQRYNTNRSAIMCSAIVPRAPTSSKKLALGVGQSTAVVAAKPFGSRNNSSLVPRAVSGGGGGFGGGGSSGSGSGGGGSSSNSGDGAGAHPMRLWTFLYAALMAGGGVMAYVKKGSTKSLTSALGAALILSLSARSMVGPQIKGSLAVCLAIAALLSVVMSGRYSRTKKLMPAGLTAGVSLAMSAAYLGFLFQ